MGSWEVATVALLLLVFSAISGRLERSLVTPAIFFTSAGLLAGPVLGLVDLDIGSEPVKLLAEATLTLVLFADASRISLPALRSEFAVPARLLGIGLPLTIAFGTLAGVGLLPGVSLSRHSCSRSCLRAPTRHWVRRSSPTSGSRRGSGKVSTSRAA